MGAIMPRGRKRTVADYEKEIRETADRIKKHPEYRNDARNSTSWGNFLKNVLNVVPNTEEKQDFWNKVKQEITGTRKEAKLTEYQKEVTAKGFRWPHARQLVEANAEVTKNKDGEILRYKSTGLPKYRSKVTGQFISVFSILPQKLKENVHTDERGIKYRIVKSPVGEEYHREYFK